MKVISKMIDQIEEVYFAVDEHNLRTPFIFGGQSKDPSVPSIAQFGSSTVFGWQELENNSIDGAEWSDWRASLKKLNCSWAIPILEQAIKNKEHKLAAKQILNMASAHT